MNGPGRFIVLEGPEGAGKSTLAAGLLRLIDDTGRPCILVREPGGTPVAEAIRAALLDPEWKQDGRQELLFFATARADLVARVIRPALAAGTVVLSDRFTLSTEAYQIGGRGVAAGLVHELNAIATAGLVPDLTLVLDLPPELGAARQSAAGKHPDRIERESSEFHRRVAQWYLAATGPGVRHLNATVSAAEMLNEAWRTIGGLE
ncbi:MAG: dTMP kinase [Gemmatimonadota bacterium]